MENLWNFLTFPSSLLFIIPIFLWGIWKGNRRVFLLSLFVYVLSWRLNLLLKDFFQVPMDPALGLTHTYAFPSGHTLGICTLWGPIAVYYKNRWITLAVIFMIVINSVAIYVLGYHTLLDILGAYYVAAIIILLTRSIVSPSFLFSRKSSF